MKKELKLSASSEDIALVRLQLSYLQSNDGGSQQWDVSAHRHPICRPLGPQHL